MFKYREVKSKNKKMLFNGKMFTNFTEGFGYASRVLTNGGLLISSSEINAKVYKIIRSEDITRNGGMVEIKFQTVIGDYSLIVIYNKKDK